MSRLGTLCALMILASGCATLQVVDGKKLNAELWQEDSAVVKKQAGFDLGCPAEAVELSVVDAGGGRATNLGARCGDKSSRYVRVESLWARQD